MVDGKLLRFNGFPFFVYGLGSGSQFGAVIFLFSVVYRLRARENTDNSAHGKNLARKLRAIIAPFDTTALHLNRDIKAQQCVLNWQKSSENFLTRASVLLPTGAERKETGEDLTFFYFSFLPSFRFVLSGARSLSNWRRACYLSCQFTTDPTSLHMFRVGKTRTFGNPPLICYGAELLYLLHC